METKRRSELQGKGWSEEEIRHAEQELERSTAYDMHFSKIVFWSALIVIIFGNLIVSFILIPFLILLDQAFLFFITIVLGLLIGFLYNFLVTDIGHLRKRHHIAAGIIVPLLAIVNIIGVVLAAKSLTKNVSLQSVNNPWVVAIVFAIAFILPYVVDRVRRVIH
jgi:hypothetical protein